MVASIKAVSCCCLCGASGKLKNQVLDLQNRVAGKDVSHRQQFRAGPHKHIFLSRTIMQRCNGTSPKSLHRHTRAILPDVNLAETAHAAAPERMGTAAASTFVPARATSPAGTTSAQHHLQGQHQCAGAATARDGGDTTAALRSCQMLNSMVAEQAPVGANCCKRAAPASAPHPALREL